MPRTARIVVPGVPHHVTQRGNRRQQVFFGPDDFARYTELIADGCREARVEVLAWCLMPNHVHLVLVPEATTGLAAALSSAHQRYTWLINRRNGWQGHLWQSRFFSCPLDDPHLLAVVRYVELNPVRAKLAPSPEQWRWSSVRGHVSGHGDRLVPQAMPPSLRAIPDWRAFLAEAIVDDEAERIRAHQVKGRPLGGPEFLSRIEALTGRRLQPKPRGRPRRENGDSHHFSSVTEPNEPSLEEKWRLSPFSRSPFSRR